MKRSLPRLLLTLMIGVAALGFGAADAQQSNFAPGNGGSLGSSSGGNSYYSYSGSGQGNYGGYGTGYGNGGNQGYNSGGYSPGYGGNFSGNRTGQPNLNAPIANPNAGSYPNAPALLYPNASGSYPVTYNGVNSYYPNINGPYGYGPNSQYQNSSYSGYGYAGNGNPPVNVYYGYPDPSFGNGGYDRSSRLYFQRGSPFSRF